MSSTTTTTTTTTAPTTVTFLGIHPLHHSKLWYFLTFGAFACITPYLPLFYREWGVSADQVGFINCLRPLVSFTFTPLWGAAADASLYVTLSSADFDAVIDIYDAAGAFLVGNDDHDPAAQLANRTDAPVRFGVPEDGVYVVLVRSYGGDEVGRYRLTINGASFGDEPEPTAAVDAPAILSGPVTVMCDPVLSGVVTASSAFGGARAFVRRGEAVPDPQPRTYLTVIPMFHVTACSATMMGSIAAGNTLVFMRKWDPVRAMEIIQTEKVHATGGVPTIAWQILEHPERARYDLSSLEMIAYGGAPSAPELVRRIYTEFGALPSNGWGMTETMATVTGHGAEDYLARPTSAGPPVPVADLKIMDEDGITELPIGEVGELWARGPMVVKGYWNKPEATAATFVDGWVRTGDLARLDEEGFVYIVDRAKDMIIRGGENIYSSEVENVLYAHPAVTDCALIGIPHRTLGEEPAAVVHLAPGTTATEAELQAWVRERLAVFKTPVAIRFVPETLPRNANGKILKKDLKGLFEDRAAA